MNALRAGFGHRVSGFGIKSKKQVSHREGETRGDLRFPSFSYPEAEIPKSESQTKIATPVNSRCLNLPLPFVGED